MLIHSFLSPFLDREYRYSYLSQTLSFAKELQVYQCRTFRWCSETECFFRPFLAFIHHTEGRRCNTCGLGCNIEAKRLGTQVSRTNLHKSFIRPPDAIRRGSAHNSDIKPFRHPCVAPTKDSPACVTLVRLFIRLPYSLLPLFYQLIWCSFTLKLNYWDKLEKEKIHL